MRDALKMLSDSVSKPLPGGEERACITSSARGLPAILSLSSQEEVMEGPARAPETMSELRRESAETTTQLTALGKMTVGELAEKYLEVFGVPSRSRNKDFLRKKIQWRIQELSEGGLPERALARIEQLAPLAPVRWRQPAERRVPSPVSREAEATASTSTSTAEPTTPARDSRLPPPGTVITRLHRGVEHQVVVLEDGFEFGGERYASLSKIARVITGTNWNGLAFFGLTARKGEEGSRG
jgi:hypothetical protein